MNLLTKWIRKRLGHHVCEEWTQWEQKRAEYVKTHYYIGDSDIPFEMTHPQEYTRQWQERRCTICGLIERRGLDSAGGP